MLPPHGLAPWLIGAKHGLIVRDQKVLDFPSFADGGFEQSSLRIGDWLLRLDAHSARDLLQEASASDRSLAISFHPADLDGLFVTEKADLATIRQNRCNLEFATHRPRNEAGEAVNVIIASICQRKLWQTSDGKRSRHCFTVPVR